MSAQEGQWALTNYCNIKRLCWQQLCMSSSTYIYNIICVSAQMPGPGCAPLETPSLPETLLSHSCVRAPPTGGRRNSSESPSPILRAQSGYSGSPNTVKDTRGVWSAVTRPLASISKSRSLIRHLGTRSDAPPLPPHQGVGKCLLSYGFTARKRASRFKMAVVSGFKTEPASVELRPPAQVYVNLIINPAAQLANEWPSHTDGLCTSTSRLSSTRRIDRQH